jgi:DNA processing protein
MSDSPFWLAWSQLLGARTLALYDRFASLEAAWQAPLSAFGAGEMRAAMARTSLDPLRLWRESQRENQQVLTWVDDAFPAPLRTIPDPPVVVFVRGRLPDWERAIAVVGTRVASPYGRRMARSLSRDLAALGAPVISGAAAGIDAQAHAGALEAGVTVAVLGCGLDHVYPAGHARLYAAIAERGALLTEHPPAERPTRYSFPRRNRLISGLSRGTIVVEAGERSGSLITADFALEQGRTVFAVPGEVDGPGSRGPHLLLRQGARLVEGVADVLEELGWEVKPRVATPRNALEASILELLGQGPRALDVLACEIPITELGPALLHMELAGLVVRQGGQLYARR